MLAKFQASVDNLCVGVASQGRELASNKTRMRLLTPRAISEQQGLLDDVSLPVPGGVCSIGGEAGST